jgi:SAM-dependent methyltransferase
MNIATDTSGNAFDLRPIDCPICGPGTTRLIGHRGGARHRYALGVDTPIVRCSRCGLLFPDPFPFPVDPQRLYGDPEKYFATHDPDAKVASYRQIIAELVVDSRCDRPSLLDVGSGRGEALHAARVVGLEDVVGLELSAAMRDETQRRYGVEIQLETIEEHAERVGRTYDIFLLSAVLEHVYDPNAMIASVARLSHPGSVVYIDVPQEPNLLTMVGNLPGRLRGTRTVYNLAPTFPPYHVFGFNPRSLTLLLEKHGFRPFRWLKRGQLRIPSGGGLKGRAAAMGARTVHRLGNATGLSTNMDAWARKL